MRGKWKKIATMLNKGEFFRLKFLRVLLGIVGLCLVFMSLEAPNLFSPSKLVANPRPFLERPLLEVISESEKRRLSQTGTVSNSGPREEDENILSDEQPGLPEQQQQQKSNAYAGLQATADEAYKAGAKALEQLEFNWSHRNGTSLWTLKDKSATLKESTCPQVLLRNGDQLKKSKNLMILPCGLMLGSSITVVGAPLVPHVEISPRITMANSDVQEEVMVSQFMVELKGLKMVDGEDPPRILHINPRLRGDWSSKPVIELNTCYRGQWGASQRCEGWASSSPDDELVDGLPKCQRWIRDEDGDGHSKSDGGNKSSWWLMNGLLGRGVEKAEWRYPFSEGKLFVMTIRAGYEGYHISVDGRHIASFPYRTGFVLEDATGFAIAGDINVRSVVATSLPSQLSSHKLLDESEKWKAPALPTGPVNLFIGIISASNHFTERMAVRKSWLQAKSILSSAVVARFFVGLHSNNDINMQVKEEAEYFGDIVMLPFMDHYELVVLKTLAICEYGVTNVTAKHIMKTDDDTFVRVEVINSHVKSTRKAPGLYMGNINQFHRPLREGKWAVTYEEWPEEEYPPYANGPGYIISTDIAKFVVEQHKNHTLRLFKMEDVSMGMWVVQFNLHQAVHYVHNLKFCQWGCVEEYYTAHYQSPRQMLCMWEKLSQGEAQCCNM